MDRLSEESYQLVGLISEGATRVVEVVAVGVPME